MVPTGARTNAILCPVPYSIHTSDVFTARQPRGFRPIPGAVVAIVMQTQVFLEITPIKYLQLCASQSHSAQEKEEGYIQNQKCAAYEHVRYHSPVNNSFAPTPKQNKAICRTS